LFIKTPCEQIIIMEYKSKDQVEDLKKMKN
jgi:hypothetical protein